MSVGATLVGGLVGTAVLTTALTAAAEARLTRMDLPFLLGTAVSDDRDRARVAGYVLHLAAGLAFSLVYLAAFAALDRSGPLLGAALGVLHALVAGTALVNVLLPAVHPRMGSPTTGFDRVALLEPPGFMMRNYGVATPLVSVVAHAGYGAIVGAFAAAG
jgi:hypothetical protein